MQTIKDYLKQSGYTQERMANKLGVSVMAVNSLLTGRRKFGVKTATAWAKAFGFNPLYLMTGEGEMLATEQPAPADAVPVYDVDFLAGFGELYDPDTDTPTGFVRLPGYSRATAVVSHTVTDIYIRRDAAKVDEALRQVAGKLPASYRPLKTTKNH